VDSVSSLPKVRYAAITDVGVKRSHNQDACAAQPAANDAHWRALGHIFIVADGMGGHAVGEKASAKAVRDIPLTYQKHVPQDGVRPAIRRAFMEANAGIYEIGQRNPEFKGMGTTATGLFLRTDGAWIGHVGDSRAYRIRGGKVEQLTFDHSWVWEIARRQGIDPDELGDFKKNVIIRSLGPDAEVEVDIEGPYPVEPGDVFLLCSDGLSNLVSADEIGAVVTTFPPEEATKFLIDLANVRGGPDNITCVIVQIPGNSGDSPPPTAGPKTESALRRLIQRWGRTVPWSYTFLGLGSACVLTSIILFINELRGAALALFAAATVLIIAGIIGLIFHLRKPSGGGWHGGSGHSGDDEPAELHVYKSYDFELGPSLLERMAELENMLRESLKGRDDEIDWSSYQRLTDEATAKQVTGDIVASFQTRCQAVQMLAVVYNKDRTKEEAFQPNWTSPPRLTME
jgi:serine/threonine protein phosphatase PrpC